jgi:flagellar biosynthesis/type III secretory pathway chaperone
VSAVLSSAVTPAPMPSMTDAQFDVLIDTIDSLTGVMEEESENLALNGRCPGLAELAAAKSRLVDQLEGGTAQLFRQSPGWMDLLAQDDRTLLALRVGRLRDAATVNADVLERQISLTNEMMAAVGMEMQRLTGRRSEAYSAKGQVSLREANAPLSINYRL